MKPRTSASSVIAATYPDDLGRMTKQETALVEVGVFGHNGESLLHTSLPELSFQDDLGGHCFKHQFFSFRVLHVVR
jgi:hypothetical protein